MNRMASLLHTAKWRLDDDAFLSLSSAKRKHMRAQADVNKLLNTKPRQPDVVDECQTKPLPPSIAWCRAEER